MAFDQIAKSLINQTTNRAAPGKVQSESEILRDLRSAGFSRADLLHEYRNLYDSTEEDSVKRQILDTISKIHGLMTPEEAGKQVPAIIINVAGDNTKVNAMLCPQPELNINLAGSGD